VVADFLQALAEPGACGSLVSLAITGAHIGDQGAEALARILGQPGACPELLRVILRKNDIGGPGARALLEAVAREGACPDLATLDLTSNAVGSEPRGALAEAMARRPRVQFRLELEGDKERIHGRIGPVVLGFRVLRDFLEPQ
jgi:hypothetical protein